MAWNGVMVSDVEARGGWQTECKMRREKARDSLHAVSAAKPIYMPCNGRGAGGGAWKRRYGQRCRGAGRVANGVYDEERKGEGRPRPPTAHEGEVRSRCVPCFPRFLRYGGEQRSEPQADGTQL